MTTLDLIQRLVEYPRDTRVVVRSDDGHFTGIGSVQRGCLPVGPHGGQATEVLIIEERPLFDTV